MSFTSKEVEYCKILIDYQTDEDTFESKYSEVLALFKQKQVPGFRKGKANEDIIRFYFKKELEEELKRVLSEEAFHTTVFENKIRPFGYPSFSMANLDGKKFKCQFMLNKQPDFELKKYTGFEIPAPAGIMSIEELSQRMLQDLRISYGTSLPFKDNDVAQMNDSIIVDYSASCDGKQIDAMTASGQIINLGKTNVPGFDNNLLGMTQDSTREFELKIPDNFTGEFAGKVIKFNVKMLTGSKNEPAPLTNELATKIGFESLDKMIENANMIASNRVDELKNMQLADQVSKQLIKEHDFKVPHWISTTEAKVNAKTNKIDWDAISDEEKEKYIQSADNNVKLSLILEKIREKEPEAQLSDEEVFKIAKDNLARHSDDPEKVLSDIFNNGHAQFLFGRVKDEYVLNFVVKHSKVVE